MLPFIKTSDHNSALTVAHCPLCGWPMTHVDEVIMAGRPREDGSFVFVHVDSDGKVTEGIDVEFDMDVDFLKSGRRHSIGLIGTCEECRGRFAIEFRQHKGETEVHAYESKWQTLTPKYEAK